jgi:hypothetical protein
MVMLTTLHPLNKHAYAHRWNHPLWKHLSSHTTSQLIWHALLTTTQQALLPTNSSHRDPSWNYLHMNVRHPPRLHLNSRLWGTTFHTCLRHITHHHQLASTFTWLAYLKLTMSHLLPILQPLRVCLHSWTGAQTSVLPTTFLLSLTTYPSHRFHSQSKIKAMPSCWTITALCRASSRFPSLPAITTTSIDIFAKMQRGLSFCPRQSWHPMTT